MEKNEQKYTVIQRLGMLTPEGQRATKQVNLIQWKGMKEPMLDIRKWDAEGNPHRGVSLTEDEVKALCEILKKACPNYF